LVLPLLLLLLSVVVMMPVMLGLTTPASHRDNATGTSALRLGLSDVLIYLDIPLEFTESIEFTAQ
jgi:hypothetical protein